MCVQHLPVSGQDFPVPARTRLSGKFLLDNAKLGLANENVVYFQSPLVSDCPVSSYWTTQNWDWPMRASHISSPRPSQTFRKVPVGQRKIGISQWERRIFPVPSRPGLSGKFLLDSVKLGLVNESVAYFLNREHNGWMRIITKIKLSRI